MTRERATSKRVLGTIVQRWASAVLVFLIAVVDLVIGRSSVPMLVTAVVLLVLAFLVSPWLFPRSSTDARARELASERDVPLIYWRVGCSYCIRLRFALGAAGHRAVWMDVSKDRDASARVRQAAGGDEVVPTVFVGTVARVNPSPSWMREQLSSR